MCEFKVFDHERLIAQDITYASTKDGELLLKDALGATTTVSDALVTEIDVFKEIVRLRKHPFIGDILRFLDAIGRCEQLGKYDQSLENSWQKVKSQGDQTILKLRGKKEGP